MTSAITKLAEMCEAFGGYLEVVEKVSCDVQSPFDPRVGLDWHSKVVFYELGANPGSIIHEMGHIFADTQPPNRSNSAEFDFFGWEHAVAKEIGVETRWMEDNEGYSAEEDGTEFGTLSAERQQEILAERHKVAVAKGLIVDGKPIAIR